MSAGGKIVRSYVYDSAISSDERSGSGTGDRYDSGSNQIAFAINENQGVKELKVLVTGGAGFIGRWVVKRLLDDGHDVWALDDLSNGRLANLAEFDGQPGWRGFTQGDIKDATTLESLFQNRFDLC